MSRKSCCVPKEWEREIDRVLEGYRNETYVCEVGQPKRHSLLESIANVSIGYLIAVAATQAILPLFGFNVSLHQNLLISAIFTGISLVRSYVLRRVFNWIHCHASRYS